MMNGLKYRALTEVVIFTSQKLTARSLQYKNLLLQITLQQANLVEGIRFAERLAEEHDCGGISVSGWYIAFSEQNCFYCYTNVTLQQ